MKRALTQSLRYLLIGLMVFGAAMVPPLASVAEANTTITGYQIAQSFSCNAGSASGQLYNMGGCSGSPADGQVFSYFVCKFEEIIVNALGDVYCSIVMEATPGIMAALTMAVMFMGMMFLMGVSPFTAKELMMFAAKFALVMAFATQAEYMIGIGYALFMNASKEGIIMVLNYLFDGSYQHGGDVYKMFDDTLKEMMQLASEDSKKEGSQCKNALFSMFVLAAAALPPLAFIGVYYMMKLVWVMLRAVFGYCQGILGVTFLVTLAPIYVSFALFKPTRTLFDKWVQYLISFSFQMVVVFAFLGMAFNIMSKMADDMKDYTDLVKPYNREFRQPGTSFVLDQCGICEMDKVGPDEKPKCKSDKVMEVGKLAQDENFLHFVSVKIFAMIIMFYILDIMMDFVPQMARYLAGPKYAGQIGGGDYGSSPGNKADWDMSLPGEGRVREALDSGAKAFMQGKSTPSAAISGFLASGGRLVQGAVEDAVEMGGAAAGAVGVYGMLRGTPGQNQAFQNNSPIQASQNVRTALTGLRAGPAAGGAPMVSSASRQAAIVNSLGGLSGSAAIQALQDLLATGDLDAEEEEDVRMAMARIPTGFGDMTS